MVLLDSATARFFDSTIRQLQVDVHREWHKDEYVCWTVNRPVGWADGSTVEALAVVDRGRGMLRANGKGGPESREIIVHLESPYRLQTVAEASIQSGNLIVLNGERVFRVDVGKPEDHEDLLMDVYLTELFVTPKPADPGGP